MHPLFWKFDSFMSLSWCYKNIRVRSSTMKQKHLEENILCKRMSVNEFMSEYKQSSQH